MQSPARGSSGGGPSSSSVREAGAHTIPSRGQPPPAVALEERERASWTWCWPLAASATVGPQMPGISVRGSPTLTCDFVNFRGQRRCIPRIPGLRTLLPPPISQGIPPVPLLTVYPKARIFIVYCFFVCFLRSSPLSDSSAIHSHYQITLSLSQSRGSPVEGKNPCSPSRSFTPRAVCACSFWPLYLNLCIRLSERTTDDL